MKIFISISYDFAVKIAFITDRVYPLYTGGYEYLVYALSRELSKYHDVSIFTSLNENYKKIGNVKYYRISATYKYTNSKGTHNYKDSVKFVFKLLLNKKKFISFDIIILNTIPYFYFGRILNKLKVKNISIFHEAWYTYLNNSNIFFKIIMIHEIKSIVRHSNTIVAVSAATEKSLIVNYKAKNVYRIPIGINIDDNNNDQPIIYDLIYLGRLSSIKHIEDLILAVKNIKFIFPKISCIIAGVGDQSKYLLNCSKRLGLVNNIRFIGYVDEDDKYPLLRSCKIFVMPSEREGFSIATLEAMYCGNVPVIANPEYEEIFGTSDFVVNNETGLYYKIGDVNDLTSKILFLLNNNEIYNKLRENAMEMGKRFDWKQIVKLYEDVLNSTFKK